MNWHFVKPVIHDGLIHGPFYCPDALLAPLLSLLFQKAGKHADVEPTHFIALDAGGMMMQDRHRERFALPSGVEVRCPSEDFGIFYERLQHRSPAHDQLREGEPLYILWSWPDCKILLTAGLRDEMLAAMEPLLADAEKRGTADHEEMMRRLRNVNKDKPRVLSARLAEGEPN